MTVIILIVEGAPLLFRAAPLRWVSYVYRPGQAAFSFSIMIVRVNKRKKPGVELVVSNA